MIWCIKTYIIAYVKTHKKIRFIIHKRFFFFKAGRIAILLTYTMQGVLSYIRGTNGSSDKFGQYEY